MKKIVILEDYTPMRNILENEVKRVIERHGLVSKLEVASFNNADSALDYCKENKANIYTILSDIQIDKETEGLDFLQKVAEIDPEKMIKKIIVSGRRVPRSYDSFVLANNVKIFYKPIKINEIDAMLNEAILLNQTQL